MHCPACNVPFSVYGNTHVYEDELGSINLDVLCPHCLTQHSTLIEPEELFEHDPVSDLIHTILRCDG
jgi:hypothetical protein